MLVAIAPSPFAARYHRIVPERRGGVACEVTAPVYIDLDPNEPDAGLTPCAYCWPELATDPTPTGMDLVYRQCRLWDAVGAWENPADRHRRPTPCPTS